MEAGIETDRKNADQHGNEVAAACHHDLLLLETMPISEIGHPEIEEFHEVVVVILIHTSQLTGEMMEVVVETIGPEMTGHEMTDGVATVETIGDTTGIVQQGAVVDLQDTKDPEIEKGWIVTCTEDRNLGLVRQD